MNDTPPGLTQAAEDACCPKLIIKYAGGSVTETHYPVLHQWRLFGDPADPWWYCTRCRKVEQFYS